VSDKNLIIIVSDGSGNAETNSSGKLKLDE